MTKLGRHFFKDKWVDWVVHVPVIIRGVRRNGRNRGMPYERTKRLPVTDLNVALSRQSEGLSHRKIPRPLTLPPSPEVEDEDTSGSRAPACAEGSGVSGKEGTQHS